MYSKEVLAQCGTGKEVDGSLEKKFFLMWSGGVNDVFGK